MNDLEMNDLEKKTLLRCVGLSAFVGLLLLVSGGPGFRYGLSYWIVFTLAALAIMLYFLQHDPELVERRLSATGEKDERQQLIRGCLNLAIMLLLVTAGIDHRMNWSDVSATVAAVALAVVALGFAVIFLTFQANSHAGATIDVDPDQPVAQTGPYALVRHPMYLGIALILLASPFALGSEWAFPWALAAVACLVWRLTEEERYLSGRLPGYDAYRRHIRYRLIPYVW